MVNLPRLVKKTLSDVLLAEGLVQANHLTEAQSRQKSSGEPLAMVLQKMGVVTEIDLARAFAKQFNLPYIDASRYAIPKEVADAAAATLSGLLDPTKYSYVVLDKIGRVILMAVGDLPPVEVLDGVERATGATLFVFVSTPGQVQVAYKKHYGGNGATP